MAKKGQRYKRYSYETKKQVVNEYLEGESRHTVMKKYEIKTDSQLDNWVTKYKENGEEGLKPQKRGRPKKTNIQTEIEQLRMENEILKKIRDLLEHNQR